MHSKRFVWVVWGGSGNALLLYPTSAAAVRRSAVRSGFFGRAMIYYHRRCFSNMGV